MSKHTKQEWQAGTIEMEKMEFVGPYCQVSAQGALMLWDGTVAVVGGEIQEEALANARLIAAAPAMYQELKDLIFLEKTAMTKKQVKMAISRAKDLINSLDI
ncbi:hypothetical protein LCGC14_2846100 [marine sediment metagenome]|uniref:Uncharacterized protein n=1 Tax=marine sediment metagenome TaxID=412755 RepID=A0A0F8YWF8_9ZZZZ